MTDWISPTIISQYAETGAENVHISWIEEEFDGLRAPGSMGLRTTGPLSHIARSPKVDFTNKTYFLAITGFNFLNLPNIISGINLRIDMQRHGRVTDDTIQLILNGNPIGDNKATLVLDMKKYYGGNNDLWNVNNLNQDMLNDTSFGVLIRFKAHPSFPHKDGAILNSVQVQIH
jgi:hypothetical protein